MRSSLRTIMQRFSIPVYSRGSNTSSRSELIQKINEQMVIMNSVISKLLPAESIVRSQYRPYWQTQEAIDGTAFGVRRQIRMSVWVGTCWSRLKAGKMSWRNSKREYVIWMICRFCPEKYFVSFSTAPKSPFPFAGHDHWTLSGSVQILTGENLQSSRVPRIGEIKNSCYCKPENLCWKF